MDIDISKPSRELDACVAEKVMGWKRTPYEYGDHWNDHSGKYLGCGYQDLVPPYSSDIAAAHRVVEKMLADGHLIGISHDYLLSDDKWVVEFAAGPCDGEATTLPLAICIAALRAKGVVE
jgi:hypothetical protein